MEDEKHLELFLEAQSDDYWRDQIKELHAWVACGFDNLEEAKRWRENEGSHGGEPGDWKPATAKIWKEAGFNDPGEAYDFACSGDWTAEEAYCWHKEGFWAQRASKVKEYNISAKAAGEINRHWGRFMKDLLYEINGIDMALVSEEDELNAFLTVAPWYQVGFDVATAGEWYWIIRDGKWGWGPVKSWQLCSAGFSNPNDAHHWMAYPYWERRIEEAGLWFKAGFSNPGIASKCSMELLSPEKAKTRYSEIEAQEHKEKLEQKTITKTDDDWDFDERNGF
jgi:hypothetical protein